jgi:hypothetical protein
VVKVTEVTLTDTPQETWANSILWRLCLALGWVDPGDGVVNVDPEKVLQEAEAIIWRYGELLK